MATASIYDVLTTQWVRDAFLTGIDLTDDQGNPLSEETFASALQSAVATTEQQLDIVVDPIEIKEERKDLTDREKQAYFAYYLDKKPVTKVTRIQCKYGSQQVADLPPVWATLMDELNGYVHLIPQVEQLAQTLPVLVASLSMFRSDYVPGWFNFDYIAGFHVYTGTTTFKAATLSPSAPAETSKSVAFADGETFKQSSYFTTFELVNPNAEDADIEAAARSRLNDGMTVKLSRAPLHDLTVQWYVTNIPDNLRRLVGIRAAKVPLAIAGNFVMGAGVMSRTVAIDGLNQSMGTTKSAAGGAYKGLIMQLEAEEAQILVALKSALSSPRFMAI